MFRPPIVVGPGKVGSRSRSRLQWVTEEDSFFGDAQDLSMADSAGLFERPRCWQLTVCYLFSHRIEISNVGNTALPGDKSAGSKAPKCRNFHSASGPWEGPHAFRALTAPSDLVTSSRISDAMLSSKVLKSSSAVSISATSLSVIASKPRTPCPEKSISICR